MGKIKPTQHLERRLFQVDDTFGERDGDGDVITPVAEERAFRQREVEPQSFDVWRRVSQSGNQVLLQTGSDLR